MNLPALQTLREVEALEDIIKDEIFLKLHYLHSKFQVDIQTKHIKFR